ncbi:hypothetical protein Y1Q_0005546 [Alligator mississippiensis]|uniref:Uncharacterized protein n=1 Tax=Alligator mississippiensis TaxID=8496 RepID=A0A151MF10_ALLMI|nr:hypothetical protein Y1Q_0005546 [Alligator mississippiensis]
MQLGGYLTEGDDAGCLASTEKKPEMEAEATVPESDSPQLVYSPNCQWLEESGLNMESLTLANGTALQLGAIPAAFDTGPQSIQQLNKHLIVWVGSQKQVPKTGQLPVLPLLHAVWSLHAPANLRPELLRCCGPTEVNGTHF